MPMKIIAAVGFTCLLTSGCGGAASSSDDADSKATPTRTVLPQRLDQPDMNGDLEPDAPADDAPFSKQLEHELSVRTLKMAQSEGKTTAQCPSGIESNKGRTVACTTTYDGLTIRWDVTIGEKAAWSESYVEYEATPSTGVITKAGVAKLLFGNYKGYIDYALCNNIPKATLVPLNVETKYKCEVVDKGKNPTGFATSTVRATEAGPRAY
ncbi:hypothetical protein ACFCXS_39325 [Streptomyces sp. NPDC056373]|uniref:hypothetical protein n=1 Tax=Streptomyces sp. NPDC056373 TaxID=3345798 RepID=UPI0035E1BB88